MALQGVIFTGRTVGMDCKHISCSVTHSFSHPLLENFGSSAASSQLQPPWVEETFETHF